MMKKVTKAVILLLVLAPRAARHQSYAQGYAAHRGQARHPVSGGRSCAFRHHRYPHHSGRNQSIIEDHFDRSPELEEKLAKPGKEKALEECLASPTWQTSSLCARSKRWVWAML